MALSSLSFIDLILLIAFSTLSVRSASGSPHFIYYNCTNDNNFTANSFYNTNLNQLLPALTSQSSSNSFFNFTSGSDPNTVYGLYYCRGDVTSQDCDDCVKDAAQKIVTLCPVQKEAIVWYQECTLRYSNRTIFSVAQDLPGWMSYSLANVPNPTQFLNALAGILDQLTQQATSNVSAKNYAKGSVHVTDSQTIYGLVQCTPDLNSTQCSGCLETARINIPLCCQSGSTYAFLNLVSCRIMYDTFPFGPGLLGSTPPPPSTNESSVTVPSQTSPAGRGKDAKFYVLAIVVPVVVGVVVLILGVVLFRSRRKIVKKKSNDGESEYHIEGATQFDLGTMKSATENFSSRNRLGEGGFGIVYKGKLQSGQEVAIKRLSEESKQGIKQFINEVQLVAKLQHRNLVKLVGFCTEGEERLVVYEFMPKLSLDYYLFDNTKTKYLSWETRYKIVEGIARGLHYLHEDSRHKVVHRDMKASNILLDEDMNPKIADFGIAKQVVVDQTQSNTTKIVGTRGYMAPEYLMAGQYSVKSDVYSFGVLLLEIVSSKSSSQHYQLENSEGLLNYAWKRWTEEEIEELIDPTLRDTASRMEVGRCIQIGLLCAQYDATSRPTMHVVLMMLNNRSMELPSPSPPSPYSHASDIPYSSYQPTGSDFSTGAWNSEKDLYPR